ncbi:MAG: hypothetical protein U1E70_24635 [Acetobacteraceae bacterium]|nr:hypothetical protein [Pseudomonadota bacterium]
MSRQHARVTRTVTGVWHFHCPQCGFGHDELGGLAADEELYCIVCDHEDSQVVVLERWLVEVEAASEPVPAG